MWPQLRRQWVQTQKRRLLKGQNGKVIAELGSEPEPQDQGDETPIGSGMIERGHRHGIQKRLKYPGHGDPHPYQQ